jgi:hypothetical protein
MHEGGRSSRFVLFWTRIQLSHNLSVSLFKKVVTFELHISISIRNYNLIGNNIIVRIAQQICTNTMVL